MYREIYDGLAADYQQTIGNKDFVPMLVKSFQKQLMTALDTKYPKKGSKQKKGFTGKLYPSLQEEQEAAVLID